MISTVSMDSVVSMPFGVCLQVEITVPYTPPSSRSSLILEKAPNSRRQESTVSSKEKCSGQDSVSLTLDLAGAEHPQLPSLGHLGLSQ